MTPTPISIIVQNGQLKDDVTSISCDNNSSTLGKTPKSGESSLIADWVRKSLFRFCKFVTSEEMMEYGQPICLFALEENNVIEEDKKMWW